MGARINPEKNTKIHGIQDFKKRFGGTLIIGYLWKYDLNPLKRIIFSTLVYLKTRKKIRDIIDNEKKI